MQRGDDSKRTAGEDMVVDWFRETLSTMQLRFVWWVLIPALSKGKRIGWMECRVERLSKVLMCQTSAVLLVGKGECLKGAKGRDYHCRQVEQPAQFHKLLPLGEQLSQGRFPELQFRGSSCTSPVGALVPLRTSPEAAVGAVSTWAGTEVPLSPGLRGGCQLAASR